MGEIFAGAAGFPTLLYTAGLAVVTCFWLLVALGGAAATAFDEDADLRAAGLEGVPVAVALSLVIAVAWAVSITGSVLVDWFDVAGVPQAVLRVALLLGSPLVGWRVARRVVSPRAKRAPNEPGQPIFGLEAGRRGDSDSLLGGSSTADY
ncbi:MULTISPECIES: hypothetical protein [unclassified Streptomyces]|uniref:hypothetical protein n=1 Tax=unclassified Streptomyces TaxID=2593676 RepID=UPI0034021AC1